jgi:hypothetical protein
MLDFIKHYPLNHYAKTLTRRTRPTFAALLAQPDRLCCAFPSGGELFFRDRLEKQPGALSLNNAPKNSRGFFNAAFSSRERLDDGRWVVIVDTPNFACEVIDSSNKPNLQTVAQLKRLTDARVLIDYLDAQSAKRFVFEPVGLDLLPLAEDKLPAKFLYVGLDREMQSRIETWFKETGQHLSAIVPMQIAALAAIRSVYPRPGLHIFASLHSTTVGLFGAEGMIDCAFTMTLGEGVPYEDFVGGVRDMALQLSGALEISTAAPVLEEFETYFFSSGLTSTQTEKHLSSLRKEGLNVNSVLPADYADATDSVQISKGQTFESRLMGCFLSRQKGAVK